MVDIDYDWVNRQLDQAKWSEGQAQTVVDILGMFETEGYSELECYSILDALNALSRGHSLTPNAPEQLWVTAQMGFVHGGDIARVKHDAFEGELGKIHNGRVGKVLAARSGDVIFRSTDGLDPYLDSAHYPPAKLERRVR